MSMAPSARPWSTGKAGCHSAPSAAANTSTSTWRRPGNTEVIRAKMRTMESLRLDDQIEDILITLAKQYHLIRLLKSSRSDQGLFLYLVLDRGKANLALARHSLKRIEGDISI